MDGPVQIVARRMRTIVVSAVNLRKGGTLSILRDCLSFLSGLAQKGEYRVVALVHKKELASYPGIEYIEMPHTIDGWHKRLWCEYVVMRKISIQLQPVHLWLSLHDTTPRVKAERQAVYCQTSFPFLRLRMQDLWFDPKIALFALFTKFAYLYNIRSNRYVIVQAEWLRKGFSRMFRLPQTKFIVAPPKREEIVRLANQPNGDPFGFIFVSTPDCHKNFETICRASELLEKEGRNFRVTLTISGHENRYARWLYRHWGHLSSLHFVGYLAKSDLAALYANADCLVFPSRVETWGLPITEFAAYDKPMLLADLPYAHETAAGCKQVAFFNPQGPCELQEQMGRLMDGDTSFLSDVSKVIPSNPYAKNWEALFDILLK